MDPPSFRPACTTSPMDSCRVSAALSLSIDSEGFRDNQGPRPHRASSLEEEINVVGETDGTAQLHVCVRVCACEHNV